MRRRYISPLVLIALALVGCEFKAGRFVEDRAAALAATQSLRDFYNQREFGRIYALGAPVLKDQITAEAFASAVAESMNRSGRFVSASLVGSSCFPREVRLVYHSEFENGKFTESILWAVPADSAQLVMYQLSPGHVATDKSSQKNCPT